MLICLSGQQHSGKDTVADVLCNGSAIKLAFADPIKRLVRDIYGFSIMSLWGSSELRNAPDANGLIPRNALTTFGDAGRSFVPNTWINKTLMDAEALKKKHVHYNKVCGIYDDYVNEHDKFDFIIITDGRYMNELEAVRKAGGKLIRVKRPADVIDSNHSSETEQKEISDDFFDYILNNDGTREDLYAATLRMVVALTNPDDLEYFDEQERQKKLQAV